MKKLCAIALASLFVCGLSAAEAPKPLVDLPLNEGDFAKIKNYGTAEVRVFVTCPEQMKWVDGPDGKAIEFSSPMSGKADRGGVQFSTPQGFDIRKPFTISFLVKTDKNLQKKSTSCLFRYSDGYAKSAGVNLLLSWNMFMFRAGVKGNSTSLVTKTTEKSILPDTWFRFAAVSDGKEAIVYVDGKVAAKGAVQIDKPAYWKNFLIGSGGSGTGYGFTGIITRFKLFDKALAPAEIADLQKP